MKYIITLSLAFSFSALASNHLSVEKVENIKLIKITKNLTAIADTMPTPKPMAKPMIGMETPVNEGGGGGSMGGGGGGK